MVRPETALELRELYSSIAGSSDTARCKSCRDGFSHRAIKLTEGYCLDCACEIFYGDVSGSVRDVEQRNRDLAERTETAWDSQSEGQRVGRGRTSS